MPKRFTDTDKWKKPFIRGLKGAYKLLWFYICDDCDHAGIWQVDIEVAELRIGETINAKDALKFFEEKVVPIDGGTKWFIPSFIEFQYPSGLNPANKAHGGIIKILEKYSLTEIINKPLTSPLQGAKDMDKEKDKVMEKDKDKEKEPKIVFANPFSEEFIPAWETWKNYKRKEFQFKYKSVESEQAAVNELVRLSSGNEIIAKQIILQSITNGWKGFFQLKNVQNGNQQNATGNLRKEVADEFNRRYGTGQQAGHEHGN